ncbi:uncharacterized protein J7T54_000260 [Emericellopsis cladophorae]|uniref:Tyrosinase copper-binding domain-containing protein n=1 Tax=Emericellopsis cladophorae TaxID=2686198 RepID=A0A9Q0BCW2_9HYPO|nr:uncharacterized protein J7T54_000260 [Emericellopsis cladophorae]KAI6779960.1 hypothetical protein J7T54_000260 [Emericellopsis cladophorae]
MYFSWAFVAVTALATFGRVLALPLEGTPVESRQDSEAALPKIDPSMNPVDALQELQSAVEEAMPPREPQQGSQEVHARYRACAKRLGGSDQAGEKGLCSLPSKGPEEWGAAQTRYDDFVALHVNLTLSVHGSGLFLAWHRAFVWSYETALRDECGYKGTQPYWNWFADTEDLTKSPVFDGSDTSLGGDGELVQHNGSLGGARHIYLPSGAGGGCIKSGPFKDASASIGPFNPAMDGLGPVVLDLSVYNPRCIQRDLNSYAMGRWYTTAKLLNSEVQGRYPDQFLGLHTTGHHYSINSDNADLYSSPNDPAFFLHHALFDRLYWMHQILHPAEAREVAGTVTLQDRPPSRNATVEDILDMGAVSESHPIKDMFDTLGGDSLCSIYL